MWGIKGKAIESPDWEMMENSIDRNLFPDDRFTNILPKEGTVSYLGSVLSRSEADSLFESIFHQTKWQNDEAYIFGKHTITKRKVAWFGDGSFSYSYSGVTKQALPWVSSINRVRKLVEDKTGYQYNSCLVNLYHDGTEGVGWHSDDEKSLGVNTKIASLSLGAERKFLFRHKKTKETVSIILETGSLLLMQGETQTYWNHSLPKARKILRPRINLTFRTFIHL